MYFLYLLEKYLEQHKGKLNLYQVKVNTTFNEESPRNFVEYVYSTLSTLKKLFFYYKRLFSVQRKFRVSLKKRRWTLLGLRPKSFRFRSRFRLRGKKHKIWPTFIKRKLQAHLVYNLGVNFNLYLKYSSLRVQLKLVFSKFKTVLYITNEWNNKVSLEQFFMVKTEKSNNFRAYRELLMLRLILLKKKIAKYCSFFLRKTLRKYRWRSFYKYVRKLKISVPKGNSLTYYLINRKYKKKRRLRISRLKPVHWAIPRYIQIDFRTLRAVFLYPPLSNEMNYAFKCSLTKISSFYKSLGL